MAITARDERGRIAKGAGGRTAGARNRRPAVSSTLPPDAVGRLYETLYGLALAGDVQAIRLLLDRLDPAPKGRPVMLPSVPEIAGAEDVVEVGRAVLGAMCAGELTPGEAGDAIGVLHRHVESLELPAHEANLTQLREQFEELETLYREPLGSGPGRPPLARFGGPDMPAQ